VIIGVAAIYLIFFHQNKQATGNEHSVKAEYYREYDSAQIQPLPQINSVPEDKASLGEMLFHDKRLSRDNSISCASCHGLDTGGIDRLSRAVGMNGAVGTVNTPTVFNSSLNFRQFWDGRATTLEEQAAGPVHNPIEMASNWDEVIPKLKADSEYPQLFKKAYGDEIRPEYIVDAIAMFERTLLTPNSRFDRYLRGEEDILTEDEKKGFQLFTSYGCSSCHQGVNLGGNMYQRFGVVEGYFKNRPLDGSDYGRFNVTGREEDRFVFKVPSLRNVEVTAPYFHDGKGVTLENAVDKMGRYQLGRKLSDEDLRLLVAFLGTLTGQWQGKTLE
jgi:cytochrome c peroxidase